MDQGNIIYKKHGDIFNKKYASFFLLFLLIFFMIMGTGNILAATDIALTSRKFSLECSNSVSECLEALARNTGIEIRVEGLSKEYVARQSFKHRTIEQILKNLFRKESTFIEWHYDNKKLNFIRIKVTGTQGTTARYKPRESVPLNDKTIFKTPVSGIRVTGSRASSQERKTAMRKRRIRKALPTSQADVKKTRGSNVDEAKQYRSSAQVRPPLKTLTSENMQDNHPVPTSIVQIEKKAEEISEKRNLDVPPMPPGFN